MALPLNQGNDPRQLKKKRTGDA